MNRTILLSLLCWMFVLHLPAQNVKEYWSNGKLRQEGMMNGECRYGLHKWWFENGQKKAEVEYLENCVPEKCMTWDEQGEIMEDIKYSYEKNIWQEIGSLTYDFIHHDTISPGIQYHIVKNGTGPLPERGNKVVVKYTGALWNGSVFEEEGLLKFKFGNREVIIGFDEAVGLIGQGGIVWVKIPPEFGYGDEAVGNIPPGSELVYKIEIIKLDNK